ncbi:MAG: sugar phosphate nucleotidyltransferase, partial [Verrucomicrobiota bacterium]
DSEEEFRSAQGVLPHLVERFREKPEPDVAEEYLSAGNFTWNAGMFIWAVEPVRKELQEHCPELASFVDTLESAESVDAVLEESFATLPKISIDYALMEKSNKIYNVEATFDWDDVGSWLSVAAYLEKDEAENRHRKPLSGLDAERNIVFSDTDQHVALLGVKDLIVVQTKDALLVADRSAADEIKKIVEQVPEDLQ